MLTSVVQPTASGTHFLLFIGTDKRQDLQKCTKTGEIVRLIPKLSNPELNHITMFCKNVPFRNTPKYVVPEFSQDL